MEKIPKETIELIRSKTNIVDVIGEYVQLKKQGRNHFGLCPFHGESTPSFSVSEDKQIFHCFGCGAGGNVFTFIMDIEGYSFVEAIAKIADKTDVQLEVSANDRSNPERSETAEHRMIQAHELLRKFYHHLLVNTKEGQEALEYLLERGFTRQTIDEFQIGYSLPSWEFTVKFLEKRGFSLEEMENSGLIIKKEDTNSYFDRFRNRIMFPLEDEKGRTVAFSGRAIHSDEQPKYLNSPETPIFHKSTVLYHFHKARTFIRQKDEVVLFEGFADVISATTADVKNSVGTMGTSLTPQHIQSLKRITDKVIICFDSDKAGMEAANRASVALIQSGFQVKIALMPDRMDPDDYIKKFGGEKFRTEVIHSSLTRMSFLSYFYRQGKNLQEEGDRLTYIEKMIGEISRIESPVEQELYVKSLSDKFNIQMETLMGQVQKLRPTNSANSQKQKNSVSTMHTPVRLPVKSLMPAHINAERKLIGCMLKDSEMASKVHRYLDGLSFYIDEHEAIVTYLYAFYDQDDSGMSFIDMLDDPELRKIVVDIKMSIDDDYEVTDQEILDYVNVLKKHINVLAIKEKQEQLKAAERVKDYLEAARINQEINLLRRS